MQNTYDQLLDQVKTTVLGLYDVKPENQWTLEGEKDGFSIHSKINPENGLKIIRTSTIAKVEADDFFNFITDLEKRKQYDTHHEESKIIEKINENTNVIYVRGKPPVIIVDARDFTVVQRKEKLGDGTLIAVSKSIEHPLTPQVKGVVRANVVFQSWILKKLPNGETNIVAIGNMDLKGDIPKTLLNQGAKRPAEMLKVAIDHYLKSKKQ